MALAALLAAAVAVAVPARAEPQGCTLTVQPSPTVIVPGRERRALIRVETGGVEPLFGATVGAIREVAADGSSAFTVQYEAPREGYPQVAIIHVVAGERCGWVALPIVGVGDAVVRGTPHARIAVTIGGRRFGPVQADGAGRAVVPVEVPPGVHAALHGAQRIPLAVPVTRHLAVVPARSTTRADRAEEVDLLLLAVDEEGHPAADAALAIAVTVGTVSTPQPAGPGVYRARWSLPPGAAAPATLRVHLPGEPPAVVTVARSPGPVHEIALSTDRTRLLAVEPAPVTVDVRGADAAGNPTDEGFALAADLGTLEGVERIAAGHLRARLHVPDFGQRRSMTVTARAGDATATATLALVPPPPPPPPPPIPVVPLEPGTRLVIAPKAGVLVAGGGAAARLAAELAGWTRLGGHELGLGLELGWSSLGGAETLQQPPGTIAFDGSVRYLSVLGAVTWRQSLGPRSMVWASAGGGAVRIASAVRVADQPAITEAGWVPAASASVAWGTRLGPGFPFLELRTTWQGDPRLPSLRGSIVPISLDVGYRLGLH